MPPRKSGKKPSKSRSSRAGGSSQTLVYVVGTGLMLSFTWVVWPYIEDLLPAQNHEQAVERMERAHPNAEVFTLPGNSLKKNP